MELPDIDEPHPDLVGRWTIIIGITIGIVIGVPFLYELLQLV